MIGRIGGFLRAGLISAAVMGALGLAGGCQEQKLKDENAALRQEIESAKAEKSDLAARQANQQAELDALRAQIAAKPVVQPNDPTWAQPRPEPRPAPTPMTRIEVSGDKLFASGSTSIMPAGKAELDKVAARIKREFPNATIRVEGYTDSDPIRKSKFASNEALSLERARAVEKYLASKGIPSSRIEAVGMGSANPKATKAASRRVEIVVMGS